MARIIVIDDDVHIREMLRQVLEHAGFEVDDAPEGRAGIELHHKNPADLIITDIIMPDKEGIETIREFRKEYPNIKIIAMSGGGHIGPDSYLKIAKSFGAIQTFTKPIQIREFLASVRQILNEDSKR